MEHDSYHVSVKLAVFSHDARRVLLLYYPATHRYGLPGGHVEHGETPDEALARELQEELGVSISKVQREDFFRDATPKRHRIILTYVARVPEGFTCQPPLPEKEHDVWVTRAQLDEIVHMSPQYKAFIKYSWPKNR